MMINPSTEMSILAAASGLASLSSSRPLVVKAKQEATHHGESNNSRSEQLVADVHHLEKQQLEPFNKLLNGTKRKTTKKLFPEILMDVLSRDIAPDVITWHPSGKSFVILRPYEFSANILPRFFKSSQYESFVRKLNRWGFRRITRESGGERFLSPGASMFAHEMFLRDEPEKCRLIKCRSTNKVLPTAKKLRPYVGYTSPSHIDFNKIDSLCTSLPPLRHGGIQQSPRSSFSIKNMMYGAPSIASSSTSTSLINLLLAKQQMPLRPIPTTPSALVGKETYDQGSLSLRHLLLSQRTQKSRDLLKQSRGGLPSSSF